MMSLKGLLLKTSAASIVLSAALNAFSANSKRLETVYLANVALYMSDNELVKLLQANKKSADAIRMLRRMKVDMRNRFSGAHRELIRPIETLDFEEKGSFPNKNDWPRMFDFNPERITRISIPSSASHFVTDSEFWERITGSLPKLAEVEICNILLSDLCRAVSGGVITCDHVSVYKLKSSDLSDLRTSLLRSSAWLRDSCVRITLKNVLVDSVGLVNAPLVNANFIRPEQQEEALEAIFSDVAFFRIEVPYREGMSEHDADKVLNYITVSSDRCDVEKLSTFIRTQYDRRMRPLVVVYDSRQFNSLSFSQLLGRELIEVDEHGSVSLMKWRESVASIDSRPILWSALPYDIEVPHDKCVIDITVPEARESLQRYLSSGVVTIGKFTKIVYAEGRPFIVYGCNVPLYASLSPAFFDAFFDYSRSEIVISENIEDNEIKSIPSRISGTITFRGNRPAEEENKMRETFAKRCGSGNIATISMPGALAPSKIRKEDLYYSSVNIAFPDLVDFEDEAETAIKQYKLFENERTTFDKNRGLVLHNTFPKPTFRYLFKKDEGCGITLQFNGVFEDVYTAPNKRLVIPKYVREINFEPKANAGLTFVLPNTLSYVNEGFWQTGNLYILNVLGNSKTLKYLRRIKDEHCIDISDRPDEFGFWHISKKAPVGMNEERFKINRIHVFQMND